MAIAIINDFDNKLFELNDIKYVRNFVAIKIGDSVRISNAYDSRFTLVVGHYTEYVVNNLAYNTSDELVSVLSSILFVKDELIMSVPSEASNTTVVSFSNIYGIFANTPNEPVITDTITFNLANAKNGGIAQVYYKGNILTKDSFIGGLVVSFTNGNQSIGELCFVWIAYDKGNNCFFVNIRADWTGDLPAEIDRPAQMTITNISDVVGGTPPAQMTITNISDVVGGTPPAQMTITEFI